jgi:hypothetical protein
MQQHKLEIKGKTFHKIHHFRRWRKLIRHAFTGININRVWKDDKTCLGSMLLPAALNGSTQMLILQQEMLLIRVD